MFPHCWSSESISCQTWRPCSRLQQVNVNSGQDVPVLPVKLLHRLYFACYIHLVQGKRSNISQPHEVQRKAKTNISLKSFKTLSNPHGIPWKCLKETLTPEHWSSAHQNPPSALFLLLENPLSTLVIDKQHAGLS